MLLFYYVICIKALCGPLTFWYDGRDATVVANEFEPKSTVLRIKEQSTIEIIGGTLMKVTIFLGGGKGKPDKDKDAKEKANHA